MPAVPIDEQELSGRAKEVLVAARPGADLGPLRPLQGGTSSITYRADLDLPDGTREPVVLKVAPAGLDPVRNRDVLRQARLLRSLDGTGLPVPRVLAEHLGAPPEIPPFFVMSFEQGECIEPSTLSADARLSPEEVRSRELDAARILGSLHVLDPVALGLGDEPEVSPADELDRWVQSFAACDEDLRAGSDDVRDLLAQTTPPAAASALIHGDFRLGNTLSSGSAVVAVIDWEIWARSDPRVDLGWFLLMANPDPILGRSQAEGMPSNEELIQTYEEARGTTVHDFGWFEALVRYKQAAISALLARNARRRGEPSTTNEGIGNLLVAARARLTPG
ncbi:MAG: phosphotransferase family protein [Acidimicrobiia bacterium]